VAASRAGESCPQWRARRPQAGRPAGQAVGEAPADDLAELEDGLVGDRVVGGVLVGAAGDQPGFLHQLEVLGWGARTSTSASPPCSPPSPPSALYLEEAAEQGLAILSADEMASMLYDSLRNKLLTLPDEVKVWPAHGAGSMCGRSIGAERSTTIGGERRTNWALADMTRERFIGELTANLPRAPACFPHDAELNRRGARPLAELAPPTSLDPADVHARGLRVLDVRDAAAWAASHVPGSINIDLHGAFASWAGALVPMTEPIALVAADPAEEHEAFVRLARVGLEQVVGSLSIDAWRAAGLPLARVPRLEASELADRLRRDPSLQLLDVRRPAEHAAGHIPGAVNLPVDELAGRLVELDPARPVAVACAGGYRSPAAAGILERAGFTVAGDLVGGTLAWLSAGLPLARSGDQEAA
jgi:hydroxyacylglutathione hydrolase